MNDTQTYQTSILDDCEKLGLAARKLAILLDRRIPDAEALKLTHQIDVDYRQKVRS